MKIDRPLDKVCARCGNEYSTEQPTNVCNACRASRVHRYGGTLTNREKQICRLLFEQAYSNKEIAIAQHLTEGTVKVYFSRIFIKVGVKSRTELALWIAAHPDQIILRPSDSKEDPADFVAA